MSARVLLGVVGYCPFVRSFPLGPELLERVQAPPFPAEDVVLRELNWGPIAIVQEFEAGREKFARAVLIAATDRGHAPNTVTCRRWIGGRLEPLAVQQRVFEAVTGIVSLDNLLVIGEHFAIWPDEVLTIEVQLAEANVGAFVLAELESGRLRADAVIGEQPLAAEFEPVLERMVHSARRAILDGAAGMPEVTPLHADQLLPPPPFCRNFEIRTPVSGRRHR